MHSSIQMDSATNLYMGLGKSTKQISLQIHTKCKKYVFFVFGPQTLRSIYCNLFQVKFMVSHLLKRLNLLTGSVSMTLRRLSVLSVTIKHKLHKPNYICCTRSFCLSPQETRICEQPISVFFILYLVKMTIHPHQNIQ